MFTRNHPDRLRMRQLCSFAAIGDISLEDRIVLQKHLEVCPNCRELLRDLEQIALIDLPAVAAERLENQVHMQHDLETGDEERLLGKIIATARDLELGQPHGQQPPVIPACPIPFQKRVKKTVAFLYPIAGWAVASLVVLGSWIYIGTHQSGTPEKFVTATANLEPSSSSSEAMLDTWQSRAAKAEKQFQAAQQDLSAVQTQNRAITEELAHVTSEYQKALSQQQSLESQVAQQESKLREDSGVLALTQSNLDDSRSELANLRSQLQDVNAHLEKQRTEAAQLREIAAKTPARIPATGGTLGRTDEQDILGARNLHIVDVYDVDHAGKSAQIYGRVYYVDRQFLLFYAFDLGQDTKNRRPVAFQAWGYQQPNSKKAESLGLFYLEDAKLDRWALRVTDPHLLARIDTLFVTMEPPGGSNMPRGKQLLLASLAGPPNHP